MKSAELPRRMDAMGRVVLPLQMRQQLGWDGGTRLEFALFGRYLLMSRQGEAAGEAALPTGRDNPLLAELEQVLAGLREEDLLLLSTLARRLAQCGQRREEEERTA